MVKHTCRVKYRCTNARTAGVLWAGVRREAEKTQQQVSGREGIRNTLASIHTVNKFPEFDQPDTSCQNPHLRLLRDVQKVVVP